jgi:hypothetical protein
LVLLTMKIEVVAVGAGESRVAASARVEVAHWRKKGRQSKA